MKEQIGYLENHIEPEVTERIIPESISKPWVDEIEFKEGMGKLEFEKEGIRSYLQYGRTNEGLATSTVANFMERPDYQKVVEEIKDWKVIDKWIIYDGEGNEVINFNPLISPKTSSDGMGPIRDFTIAFPALNEIPISSDRLFAMVKTKRNKKHDVILTTNITSPQTLLTVLHEIGHEARKEPDASFLDDLGRYTKYIQTLDKNILTEQEREDPDIEEKMLTVILKEERDAWAFAINKIRPLIRANVLNKEDVLTFIHSVGLKSYSDVARMFLEPSMKQKFQIKFFGFLNTLLGAK